MDQAKDDTLNHLNAALQALSLEAWNDRGEPLNHFTIAEELKRVDSAIGPKGQSMFFKLANDIETAYVEILAAKKRLMGENDNA